MKLTDLDHPLIFLLVISVGVAAMFALFRFVFASLNMPGPLGLFTMGTGHNPVNSQVP